MSSVTSKSSDSPGQRVLHAILAGAFAPIDAAWLGAQRVLLGLCVCVSMLRFIAYDRVDPVFVRPHFHFKYWGFGWIEPLSAAGMHLLIWALAAIALLMAAGVLFRVSAILLFLGFAYLQLIDVTIYLNHYYLLGLLLFLLALSPAGRVASVDALVRERSAASSVSQIWLWLFRFQVGVVYVFAGLAKAHGDWLVHAQPLRIWLSSKADLPLAGALLTQPWTPSVLSWGGFLFDTLVVVPLSFKRLRPYAFLAVIGFHVATFVLFPMIGVFPAVMVISALAFFPPSWPRAIQPARLRGPRAQASQVATPRAHWRKASLLAAGVYALIQLALPLRSLAYGGNVLWHEQGMRFSWRVMVRKKGASVTFHVRSKQTGHVWQVTPEQYLNQVQQSEMSEQPDLILQLAHHIGRDFVRRRVGAVEVRAEAWVSLNGRSQRLLIDPTIDLMSVHDGFERASWILPAPTEAPPHIRAAI